MILRGVVDDIEGTCSSGMMRARLMGKDFLT